MDNELKQRNRRRKRAQRMQAIREKKPDNNDSGEEEDTVKPQRPPTRRRKSKEPLVEEDIIDGFAILGFKTYEDLEVSESGRQKSRHSYLLPPVGNSQLFLTCLGCYHENLRNILRKMQTFQFKCATNSTQHASSYFISPVYTTEKTP